MKFATILLLMSALAVSVFSQYTPPSTTEYQPETTDSHYWDPDTTTAQPDTTTRPTAKQSDCGFPGPCGQVPKDAKKMYFFF